MTLVARERPATRLEAWSLGAGLGLSILAISFIAWAMTDVDGDGTTSFQEVQDGTRPMNADSDGDGVTDGWEKSHGFSAVDAASAPPMASPQQIEQCLAERPEATGHLPSAPTASAQDDLMGLLGEPTTTAPATPSTPAAPTAAPTASCAAIQDAYGDEPDSAPASTPASPTVTPQTSLGITVGGAILAVTLAALGTILTARRILK